MQTTDDSTLSPSVIEHFHKLLDEHKWSVYYYSEYYECSGADIIGSDLSFAEAVECIKLQPKKDSTHVTDHINKIAYNTYTVLFVEGQPPKIDNEFAHESGPFLAYGSPEQVTNECGGECVQPAIKLTKDQVLKLIDKQ